MNDVVGCGKGEPRTPCLQRQHEQGRPAPSRVLEPGDEVVPLTLAQPSVQVPDLAAESGTEVSAQQVAELGILREQQRLLPRGEHLIEGLLHARQLPRASSQAAAVFEELRRVVADLLELGHGRQDQSAALDAIGALDAVHHVRDDRLVERGLFAGQRAHHLHLDLGRQVGDDRRVGLQPAQHERLRQRSEAGRCFGIAVSLDGRREARLERRGLAQQSGVGELHQRPEVAQPVLHRGPGHRKPVRRRQRPHRNGRPGRRVLDRLGFVEDDATPAHLTQRVDVADHEPVCRHDQIGFGHHGVERLALGSLGPVVDVHPQSGGEAGRLPLPVADQRHRADQQGRAPLHRGLAAHEGEQLHRLAQTHVVRKDTAQTDGLQERQPGQTTLLVGAQLTLETLRSSHGRDPVVYLAGQEVREPALSLDVHDGQATRPVLQCPEGHEHLPDAHPPLAVRPLGQERPGPGQPVGVDVHPLTAHPYQRLLGLDEIGDLLLGQGVLPDGQIPSEVNETITTDHRLGLGRAGLRGGRHRELRAQAHGGIGPPPREQHAEAGGQQDRRGLRQEQVRALDVQGERRRLGGAQRTLDVRVEPYRPTEFTEQGLLRIGDVTCQRPQRPLGTPHLRGVNDQARLLRRLQREVHPPRGVGHPLARSCLDSTRRLDQSETGPNRTDLSDLPLPVSQCLVQGGQGDRSRGEERVGARQRRSERRHCPPALSRPQARAHRCVHQSIGRSAQRPHRDRTSVNASLARSREGAGQSHGRRPQPHGVGSGHHRRPHRHRPTVARVPHTGQYPAASDEIHGKPSECLQRS